MRPALLAALSLLAVHLPALAQVPMTLDKAKASGEMTLAYREASIPFSYLGNDAKPVGFGWEICLKVVEQVKKVTGRADLKVGTQAVTSQNRIPLLQNGTIDIECGSTTNNSDRQKQVTFAISYFYTGTRLMVLANSPIKSVADLKGKKVVSTVGTTNMQVLRKLNTDRGLGFELLGAKDHPEAALMVQAGRADAYGMDDILLYGLRASAQNPASLAVVGEAIQVEPYGIMLRKDDPVFKKLADDTIIALFKSGEINKIYARWFESPIPPKNVNLLMPMNNTLKRLIRSPNAEGVEPCGRMHCGMKLSPDL